MLPLDPTEAKRVKKSSSKFTLIDGDLFRFGFTHPVLVCVHGEQCTRIMSELHEGVCGSHVGGRALASRVLRAGYYWPTLKEDCAGYAQCCKQCQQHAHWHKGTWAEEVPRIVWAYHTTPQSSTHETPFSLVYGSDAMIPVEIQESSPRFLNFVAEESNEERKVNLDLLDEVREEARISAEAVKRRVERRHNSKVRPRQFQEGNLVMRKAHQHEMENKLSPKWTGPFRVVERGTPHT